MLAVALGAALFGVGMVVYGYCPGTDLERSRLATFTRWLGARHVGGRYPLRA